MQKKMMQPSTSQQVGHKWLQRHAHVRARVRARSRRGEAYASLIVFLLPLFIVITVLVFNGLSAIAAQRRAQGLATLGIQAGTSAVHFDGSTPNISPNACAVALAAIRNTSPNAVATCTANSRLLTVQVAVKPPQLGFAGLIVDYARFRMSGGPGFGINHGE